MTVSRSTAAKDATSSQFRAAFDVLKSGDSGELLRRAQWLASINQLLRPYLPPELAAHTRLANIQQGQLQFVVDSATWNSKLRLLSQPLLEAARACGVDATRISIRTSTRPITPPALATQEKPMSARARAGLQATRALLQAELQEESLSAPRVLRRSK